MVSCPVEALMNLKIVAGRAGISAFRPTPALGACTSGTAHAKDPGGTPRTCRHLVWMTWNAGCRTTAYCLPRIMGAPVVLCLVAMPVARRWEQCSEPLLVIPATFRKPPRVERPRMPIAMVRQ